ncbi:MAG: S-layer homology domain-containing protein [Fervidobacterium sp.]|uniref:S-layer homology domain-containing protein n=1 Tax=Fervidobacterium sp. TaxID=1871331 RepID=UPI00404A46AB
MLRKHFTLIAICLFLTSIYPAVIRDLSPSASDYKAVNFLVDEKIMDVDANNNFKPSLLVTKLDLARYLYALVTKYNLTGRVTDYGDSIKKLESRISSLERQLENLSKTSSSAVTSAQVTAIQNEINDLKKRISNLENTTIVSSAISKSIEQSLVPVQSDLANISKRLNNLEGKVNAIPQPKDYTKDLETINSKITNLEKVVSNLPQQKDIQQINERINNLSSSIKQVNDEITKFKIEIRTELKTEVDSVSKKVDGNYQQQLEELEKLRLRVQKLEEVINKGDDFLRRLNAIDALTLVNIFSTVQVLNNRFDQIEDRYTKLENKISEISVEQQYVMSEIAKVSLNADKVQDLDNKVQNVEKATNESTQRLDSMSLELSRLQGELKTTRIIAISAVVLAAILGIIVLLK